MEFITGKHLSRRTFLRGAGATVALPLLDAMVPAGRLWAREVADPTRLVCIEMVHGSAGSSGFGAAQNYWSPAATGRGFDLSPTALSSLEPYRDLLTIISDTDVEPAEARQPKEIGGDHFRSSATFLTQAHPKQTESSDVFVGTSMDQLYANRFGQDTPIPSMQLCIENVDQAGGLRVRVRVRLHGHDQLVVADAAASDDPGSAGRVRPALRGGRDAGGARGATTLEREHPRLPHR